MNKHCRFFLFVFVFACELNIPSFLRCLQQNGGKELTWILATVLGSVLCLKMVLWLVMWRKMSGSLAGRTTALWHTPIPAQPSKEKKENETTFSSQLATFILSDESCVRGSLICSQAVLGMRLKVFHTQAMNRFIACVTIERECLSHTMAVMLATPTVLSANTKRYLCWISQLFN